MENEKMFLIHEDDYIRHIDEKLELYAMLRQTASAVKKLPDSKANKEAKRIAGIYTDRAEAMYDGWGIPDRYLITADMDDLCELMENELIEPEEAGYYPDDDCPCCCCERCCEFAEEIELELSDGCENGYECEELHLLELLDDVKGLLDELKHLINELQGELDED